MSFTAEHSRRARADFPALARLHEGRPLAMLDGPAGTQVPRQVLEAMREFYCRCNTNTGGAFATSRELEHELVRARETFAAFLGAEDAATISFGANMTTLSFALADAVARLMRSGDEVLITALDHEANRGPWLALAERGGLLRAGVSLYNGRDDLERLLDALTGLAGSEGTRSA